jgi:hypothetical protein
MSLYPAQWGGRLGRAVLDLLAAAWTVAWVLAGLAVHNLVLGLQVIADSITGTGRLLNSWVADLTNAVPQGVPLVSGALNSLVGALPSSAGDTLVRSGMSAHDRIDQLAIGLGVFVAAAPILAVIPLYLLWRVGDVRERSAARAFVETARRTGRLAQARALLAQRAVVSLSFKDLMQASSDPIADLTDGRHDALAAALLRRQGLPPLSDDIPTKPALSERDPSNER